MINREVIEKIREFENTIRDQDLLFLVEGKHDREALNLLNVKNIIEISRFNIGEIDELIKKVNVKEIVILTDHDKEGKRKYKEIKSIIEHHTIKENRKIREKFFETFKVRKVEEARKIIEEFQESFF